MKFLLTSEELLSALQLGANTLEVGIDFGLEFWDEDSWTITSLSGELSLTFERETLLDYHGTLLFHLGRLWLDRVEVLL